MSKELLQVFPRAAMDDVLNGAVRDLELLSQHATGRRLGESANFSHLCFRQARMTRGVAVGMPSLCHRIVMVVGVGAEEQVGGADTAGVVAVVADQHPIRDGAMLDFPRKAMGVDRSPGGSGERVGGLLTRRTYPAFARAIHLGPEPRDGILGMHGSHSLSCHAGGVISTARPSRACQFPQTQANFIGEGR